MDQKLTKLHSRSNEFQALKTKFEENWEKGEVPTIKHIFKINVDENSFDKHLKAKAHLHNTELLFHGTKQACTIGRTKTICLKSNCNTCSIIRKGWKKECFGTTTGAWGRFGRAIYFTKCSSKANDYNSQTEEQLDGYRSVLAAFVTLGNTCYSMGNFPDATSAPSGYHSVIGDPSIHPELNYHEVAVYSDCQAVPAYLIVYHCESKCCCDGNGGYAPRSTVICDDCEKVISPTENHFHICPNLDYCMACYAQQSEQMGKLVCGKIHPFFSTFLLQ